VPIRHLDAPNPALPITPAGPYPIGTPELA
jgi:hypothetical protein